MGEVDFPLYSAFSFLPLTVTSDHPPRPPAHGWDVSEGEKWDKEIGKGFLDRYPPEPVLVLFRAGEWLSLTFSLMGTSVDFLSLTPRSLGIAYLEGPLENRDLSLVVLSPGGPF